MTENLQTHILMYQEDNMQQFFYKLNTELKGQNSENESLNLKSNFWG